MKVGDKIRNLRTLKKLSQENMAEMLEMSLGAYGDIERNKKDINLARLEQIAKSLGVSVMDILSFGDKISNFFDQCNGSNINAGNSPTQTNNYDQRELQHQIEKQHLALKLLQAEKDKSDLEAKYWREKCEKI
jgi:transcriptional regulator with XRE-family HTH domain